jgi:hypothetical protein
MIKPKQPPRYPMSASKTTRESLPSPHDQFQTLLSTWKGDKSVKSAQEVLFFLSNINDFRLLEKVAEKKNWKPFDFGTAWSNAAQAVIMFIYTQNPGLLTDALTTLDKMLSTPAKK